MQVKNDSDHLIQKYSIFNTKESKRLIDEISEICDGTSFHSNGEEKQPRHKDMRIEIEMDLSNLSISDKMHCTICNCPFDDRDEQVSHYKSDIHRFNLKRKLNNKPYVSVDEFENMSDISSISGSDSDGETGQQQDGEELSDSDAGDMSTQCHYAQIARGSPKISFKLNDEKILVMYRCLLHGKKNIPEKSDDLLRVVRSISTQDQWCIILINAGHFAAVIFKGEDILVHKTFHRYVIRAKRGTVQSVHDQKSHAKSAGANIRRSQEAAFKDDIKSLMDQWKRELDKCTCVFLRAPKYNQQIFFAGRNPIFTKYDTRIRHIPFVTYRPTFNEAKRTHVLLRTIELYDQEYLKEPSKSQEVKESSLKKSDFVENFIKINLENESDNKTESDDEENTQTQETHEERRRHSKRKLRPLEKERVKKSKESSTLTNLDTLSIKVFNELYSACLTNDCGKLSSLFDKYKQMNDLNLDRILNQRLNQSGSTLLHLTCSMGFGDCIWILLLNGADPTIEDYESKRVPYQVCQKNQNLKDIFQRFMHDYPLLYDYDLARIPSGQALALEIEKRNKEREKKKIQRKQRKDRESIIKESQKQAQLENEEKRKFLQLSDQEKRILMVERKFLSSAKVDDQVKQKQANKLLSQISTQDLPSCIIRCWNCGDSLATRVPFEYYDYKFCTTKCLKLHRDKNKKP